MNEENDDLRLITLALSRSSVSSSFDRKRGRNTRSSSFFDFDLWDGMFFLILYPALELSLLLVEEILFLVLHFVLDDSLAMK